MVQFLVQARADKDLTGLTVTMQCPACHLRICVRAFNHDYAVHARVRITVHDMRMHREGRGGPTTLGKAALVVDADCTYLP